MLQSEIQNPQSVIVLLHRHAFRNITEFIDVTASQHSDVIIEKLKRDNRQKGDPAGVYVEDINKVVHFISNDGIPFGDNSNHPTPAVPYFLNIAQDFVIHLIPSRNKNDGHILINQGDRQWHGSDHLKPGSVPFFPEPTITHRATALRRS
jgi:hypothetical protein